MLRPSLLIVAVVAAVLPALALATPVSTQVPVAGSFETVALRGDFEAQVREGAPASVEILAEPGMAGRVQVEVTGGELRLSRREQFDSAKGIVVKVVLPHFRGLSVKGSGTGTAESGASPRDVKLAVGGSGDLAWKGTAAVLDMAVSGSGSLRAQGPSAKVSAAVTGSGTLDVSGDTGVASVAVSGSGDVKLSGKGDRLKAALSGSGDVDAKGFAAKDASVSIAGSGDVDVRLAGGTLSAQIAGSGNVFWSGEGTVGPVASAGSGRVGQR